MNLIDKIRISQLELIAQGKTPTRVRIPEVRRNELMSCWQMNQFEGMRPDLIHGLPFEFGGDEVTVETT